MALLISGLVVFFAAHIFSATRARGPGDIKERLGYGPYMGLYSLVSAVGLTLMIYGYGLSRGIPVWDPPVWTRHLPLSLMVFSMILLVAAYTPTGYIKEWSKHPYLLAVKIWAASHLLSNGDLASIFLFGAFLAYAVFDRIMLKRRGDVGAQGAAASFTWDVVAIGAGTGLYALIAFYLHEILFGIAVVAPLY